MAPLGLPLVLAGIYPWRVSVLPLHIQGKIGTKTTYFRNKPGPGAKLQNGIQEHYAKDQSVSK